MIAVQTRSLLLPGLVLVNVVIKLLWLDAVGLVHDEPFTVYWSQRPLAELWAMFATENNPPLYFLLIKTWSAMVPFEVSWLRVPSALFSAFTVWPLFLLSKRLGGMRTAVIAALLFTLSNYHFGFAHEVRAYSLFALLATSGMWLLWYAVDHPQRIRRNMLLLAAVNAAMVYTHFFGWLAIGVQLLCVLLLADLRPLRRDFLLGLGITVAAFLPYASIFLDRSAHSVGEGTWLEAPVPEELYNMIWRWSNAPVVAVGSLLIIVIALVRSRVRTSGVRMAVLWTFVPLFGMYLASYAAPMFLDRYLVYAAPGFALLVALCIEALAVDERVGRIIGACVVVGMAVTFTPWKPGPRDPARVVEAVKSRCANRCTIELVPAWYWLNYLAAEDLEQLKADHSDLLRSTVSVPSSLDTTPSKPVLVVDATGGDAYADRSWYGALRAIYPQVDSVEADHRVWLYRFAAD